MSSAADLLPLVTPCASFDEWKRPRARFEKYTMPEPNSGCLLWVGAIDSRGYGHIKVNGRIERAHRLALILGGQSVAPRAEVLHKCDNKVCVRVDHLILGTRQDNMDDMAKKKRGRRSKRGLPFGVKPTKYGRFQAQIKFHGRQLSLGNFDTAAQASAAAVRAKKELRNA